MGGKNRLHGASRIVVLVGLALSMVLHPNLGSAAYKRPSRAIRVDLTSAGLAPTQHETAGSSSISRNGRLVAFDHGADQLVSTDANLMTDVFVHDPVRRSTTIVSTGVSGEPAVGAFAMEAPGYPETTSVTEHKILSFDPSISGSGRYVAFVSLASNLVPSDTNLVADIFVRDRKVGSTERVSVGPQGEEALGVFGSYFPSISADGRYISFTSDASNLVDDDTNNYWDVFVYDRQEKETSRVSVSSEGTQASVPLLSVAEGIALGAALPTSSIAGDGSAVVFDTASTGLVADDMNEEFDVYVRDLAKGTTRLVSRSSTGDHAVSPALTRSTDAYKWGSSLNGSEPNFPASDAISADGRLITFYSTASNLVPNDRNMTHYPAIGPHWGADVFVFDRKTERVERVSVEADGREVNSPVVPETGVFWTGTPSISGDGRFVSFYVWCTSCSYDAQPSSYSGEYGTWSTMGTFDRETGQVVTGSPPGEEADPNVHWANAQEEFSDMSFDGRYISYRTWHSTKVPGLLGTDYGHSFHRRDMGSPVGVLQLRAEGSGAARLPSPEESNEARVLVSADDPDDSLLPEMAELIGGQLIYRPVLKDLYLKIEAKHLDPLVAKAALVFGARFEVDGRTYEVRTTGPTSRVDASPFALFECEGVAGKCEQIGTLRGGYGTVGDSVVASVPLASLGLQNGGSLTDVEMFSAMSSPAGLLRIIDSL